VFLLLAVDLGIELVPERIERLVKRTRTSCGR
jgi:hypothetical protein